MPLPVKDIIDMIRTNISKRGTPLPISDKDATGWTDGLDIPMGGETILYTGLLYQLNPYIDSVVDRLDKLDDESLGGLLKVGKVFSGVLDISRFFVKPDKGDIMIQHEKIRRIALLLKKAGVEFGYLYKDEMYSGVLLYDLGLEDDFKKHAEKVFRKFKEHNVKKIITIDPHSTHVLRSIYPQYIKDFDIQVKNYLEILVERDLSIENKVEEKVTIHDPCYYARYENIVREPRILLGKGGLDIVEPEKSGRLTYCCGGPLESLSPKIAAEVAKYRAAELSGYCDKVVTMCPICYSNLRRVARGIIEVEDVSSVLWKIYGD